jgi:hypothetical protein
VHVSAREWRLAAHWTPYALVSLHALARRIERGADRFHAALVRDLAVLADAGDDGDRVPTPLPGDGGGAFACRRVVNLAIHLSLPPTQVR